MSALGVSKKPSTTRKSLQYALGCLPYTMRLRIALIFDLVRDSDEERGRFEHLSLWVDRAIESGLGQRIYDACNLVKIDLPKKSEETVS